MTNTNIKKIAAGLVAVSTVLFSLGALPVAAQGVNVNLSLRLPQLIVQADKDIVARIDALNNLNARVQVMRNVSATEKTNISNQIATNITGLTTLKAKIDSDTDIAVARVDAKSVFGSFRIYALVIPQGYVAVSADRANTISGLMIALGVKLQARITAAQTAGKDITALQTALADMISKVTEASSQASIAQNGVAGLTPDQSNAAVAASNKTALVAARANIKTAILDLKTARQDIKTIIDGLKAFKINQ